jgi:NAD(P)-dependent dehydrogenase (short-subunit alcohol dehydrogenase family)
VIVLAAATADEGTGELARALGELGPLVVLSGAGPDLGDVPVVRADLTTPEGAAGAWLVAEKDHGSGDVLVTLPAAPPQPATFTETSNETWESLLRDHLFVAANTARAAAGELSRQGHGVIAMVTWQTDALPGHVAMATVCGAVAHFARTLASEVGEDGVTVNALSVPVGRPANAAPALRLLCSPDGGYLTSESLALTGADP